MIENTRYCLAIEGLCASQAIDFQSPLKTSEALQAVHQMMRKSVPKIEKDRVFNKDIESIYKLIENTQIINECEKITGVLK